MGKAHYFLGSRLLGTGLEPFGEPAPYALFCYRCGELWGRVAFENGNPHYKWTIRERLCVKHRATNPEYDSAGSFIPEWRHGCPEELPKEVLLYELQLRLT